LQLAAKGPCPNRRRLEALTARLPDPADDEVERPIAPVRDELRRLADEPERRH
jgi:hypothetical protein